MLKYLVVICLVFLLTCHLCESSLNIDTASKPKSIKIAGGIEADENEFPFIISIQKQVSSNSFEHLCTGSILTSTWILTAAHCIDKTTTIVVAYGSNDNTCTDSSCRYIKVKNQISHPSYDPRTERHDIALYELERELPIDNITVSRVSIDANSLKVTESESDSSRLVLISGWGAVNEDLDYPSDLQKASVPIVDMSYCDDLNLGGIKVEQICAGAGDGRDACSGDSGGPMFRKLAGSNNGYTQYGIVSTGYEVCGATISRGIYINTTHYLPFIKTYVPGVSVNYDWNTINPGNVGSTAVSHFGLLYIVIFLIGSFALL